MLTFTEKQLVQHLPDFKLRRQQAIAEQQQQLKSFSGNDEFKKDDISAVISRMEKNIRISTSLIKGQTNALQNVFSTPETKLFFYQLDALLLTDNSDEEDDQEQQQEQLPVAVDTTEQRLSRIIYANRPDEYFVMYKAQNCFSQFNIPMTLSEPTTDGLQTTTGIVIHLISEMSLAKSATHMTYRDPNASSHESTLVAVLLSNGSLLVRVADTRQWRIISDDIVDMANHFTLDALAWNATYIMGNRCWDCLRPLSLDPSKVFHGMTRSCYMKRKDVICKAML